MNRKEVITLEHCYISSIWLKYGNDTPYSCFCDFEMLTLFLCTDFWIGLLDHWYDHWVTVFVAPISVSNRTIDSVSQSFLVIIYIIQKLKYFFNLLYENWNHVFQLQRYVGTQFCSLIRYR